jgi:TonB family protein
MNWFRVGNRPKGLHLVGIRLVQAAACALVLAMALPARAADDRAVKSRVSPIYPEIAKRMKIGGVVKLEATVDPEGKVTGVKALSGNRMLAEAAENAVKQWKFVPGASVASVDVEINFAVGQ